ncbi:hypothetical protein M3I53_22715 [Paraburkholderia sp. CNPSo 3272]|uniref:hypothetical protein n=1 Tax=Paraburkholderia sp. CNPSo 3272 TaxID=2940931 RepID=UPI0020B72C4B|nr:hypothetical protein [Paraburkholderia sp. CNPSo 3272]MCP3725908.1 hypothetical protein [Paraburkholderia sp. CNPSo 3272]
MRDELMTEALCWQVESKVSADHAYQAKAAIDLSCYCPHDACLVKVYPKKLKNTYFYAPERHVAGCPNEARSTEPSIYPGEPRPRPADEPRKPVPNLLGPGPTLRKKTREPTRAELLQLAVMVRTLPAYYPGTLEEVVDAWSQLSPGERALQSLTIGDLHLTYETAFTFLGSASDDIDALNPRERIIFGASTVREADYSFLIESRKRFLHEAKKVPLLLVSSKKTILPDYLPTLAGKKATLFWHGAVPRLTDKKNAFRFDLDASSPYAGVALRSGEQTPWGSAVSPNAPA